MRRTEITIRGKYASATLHSPRMWQTGAIGCKSYQVEWAGDTSPLDLQHWLKLLGTQRPAHQSLEMVREILALNDKRAELRRQFEAECA